MHEESSHSSVYKAFEKDGLTGFKDEFDGDKIIMVPRFDCDADYAFDGIAMVSKNGFIGYLKVPSGEWLKEPQFI